MLKNVLFVLMTCTLSLFAAETECNFKPCKSKEACLNDPNCLCWCSQVCNWRKKTAEDHPYYVENDPHGKHCYCKKWDYDNYTANCIEGKNIKEPPGAE